MMNSTSSQLRNLAALRNIQDCCQMVDYKFFKSSFVHSLHFFLVPMQAFAAALCIVPVENQIITVYISENRAAGCNLIHTCDIQV